MRRLTDFTTDDLKYLKLGSIASVVIAFLFAWFIVSPFLTNISAVVWFSISEDWIRANLEGAMYAEDSQIIQALKRDTRWICQGLCILGVVVFSWRLTFLDPEFYIPSGSDDVVEARDTDRTDN